MGDGPGGAAEADRPLPMIVLFVVLILFSDITDDSPFQYVIF